MTRQEIHDRIVAARDYMAEHGMAKYVRTDMAGRACLLGAFDGGLDVNVLHIRGEQVIGSGDPIVEVLRGVMNADERRRAATDPLWSSGLVLVNFNNHYETTRDEVLALYDRAIAATAPCEAVEERELALA